LFSVSATQARGSLHARPRGSANPREQYRYAFRIDDASWAAPDGPATVDDGFGGKSAWLTVDPPDRSARSVLEALRASPVPT